MSYARFGEDGSDVYVYFSTDGHYVCLGCLGDEDYTTDAPGLMIDHLTSHVMDGDNVPRRAFDELEKDVKTGKDQALRFREEHGA